MATGNMRYRKIDGTAYVRISDVIQLIEDLSEEPENKYIRPELNSLKTFFLGLYVKALGG